jgi:hypothetical protein
VPIWPNLFNYKIGNAKHTVLRVGAMIGWLGVQIMCLSGTAYLHVDYCFSELTLKLKHVDLEQNIHHHHLI